MSDERRQAIAVFEIAKAEAVFEAKAQARALRNDVEAMLDQQTLDAARAFWGQL